MIRILVVDDDQDFLRLVEALLHHAGFTVTTANDAYDAVDKLQHSGFDLILSDANMPRITGFELVKMLRKHLKNKKIAIALLTGRRDKKDIQLGLDAGADDYIVKPIDPDLFITKVKSLVSHIDTSQNLEYDFSKSPVNMTAKWEVHTQILMISENGLIVKTPFAGLSNQKIKLESYLFELIGLQTPTLRVISFKPIPEEEGMYETQMSFIGMTDPDLQKIRAWINSNVSGTKARKSA